MEVGFKVSEDAIKAFDDLKMHKSSRYITFKIEGSDIVQDSSADRSSTWEDFVKSLPKQGSKFAVYDFQYVTNDKPPREVEKLIFIHWCPDDASAKEKMLSASARGTLRKGFTGIARDIQAKDISDLDFEEVRSKL